MSPAWGLHWFRRDLRLTGNPALLLNGRRCKGRTVGLFCFDSKFLTRPDFSHNRFGFFLRTLAELRDEMRAQGGDLLVIDCLPQDAFPRLFEYLTKNSLPLPELVTWNRDYEPFARQRDDDVAKLLKNAGVAHETCRDHLLFEPEEIVKDDGEFYQIFSPYARQWFTRLHSEEGKARLAEARKLTRLRFNLKWSQLQKPGFPFQDAFTHFEKENQAHVTIPLPEVGAKAALQRLKGFSQEGLKAYHQRRDQPADDGTSRLSVYLKNGSLTSAQVLALLQLGGQQFAVKTGPAIFAKEITWREFYYTVLYHRPEVEKQSFLPQYADLKWPGRDEWFTRWKEGTTGFPIVDAGMRELASTGWMHNRVRMIVASFLTKDLLIDWRRGEQHFMHQLLDGDLAPNNGGWQWAASTGCDPQPYFRIFNPWLQSKKFDPEGEYIRRYIPELREISTKQLHTPDGDRGPHYPPPIVQHEQQRAKALALYKKV